MQIQTFIKTYPIEEDVLVDVNDVTYVKNVYEQQYTTLRGVIYGAISFTIDGQKIVMSSHNLNETWLSLSTYLLTKEFNFKQRFLVCVDDHDVQLVNGCDQNHPQIRLKYQYGLTDWILTDLFREVLLSVLHDYMSIVKEADTNSCFDDEGDAFDYSTELKGLLENYAQL